MSNTRGSCHLGTRPFGLEKTKTGTQCPKLPLGFSEGQGHAAPGPRTPTNVWGAARRVEVGLEDPTPPRDIG